MEKQLKCVLLLSLEEITLRRLAVFLWSGSDILASILKVRIHRFFREECKKEWQETVEYKVKDKVLKLELPKSLTKQMIEIVWAIGLQIKRWKERQEYHLRNGTEKISLPNSAKLFWTTSGLIEYRKTAEELARCDLLNVVQRFKLACINCLEDYIPLLWEELPKEKKYYFYNKVLYRKPTSPFLHYCWPHILKGELYNLDYLLRTDDRNLTTFNQWAFEHSVEECNKTAAGYFFQKLTHEERETSLMRSAHALLADPDMVYLLSGRLSDIVCYLLSLMTPEQQMKTFKAHPIDVFLCFLDWPLQDLFLENAGLIWTFLLPSGYGRLLHEMASRYENSYHYFPKLFQEFFMQSPLDLKKCFVDLEYELYGTPAFRFLSIFFKYQDSESIEVMFRNVDAVDRVKLVLNRRVLRLFYDCILGDRWHMVEVCLREATLSKEDRKRMFMECFINDIERIKWKSQKLERFFEFLGETDASADK